MLSNKFFISLFLFSILYCRDDFNQSQSKPSFEISSEKYSTNINGNIMIYVNIWGEVEMPGRHLVSEGISFATLLSIVGGPTQSANLKKVRLFRETKPKENIKSYTLNLKQFLLHGDRSDFIEIHPNDTIIIPQKISTIIFNRFNSINTIMSFLTLYFTYFDR